MDGNVSGWLEVGMEVEAESSRPEFHGVWWRARVVRFKGNIVTVEYPDFVEEDDNSVLERDTLHIRKIRPCPRRIPQDYYHVGDRVDAYDKCGWWTGQVVGRAPDRNKGGKWFRVYFTTNKAVECHPHITMRPSIAFCNGKWKRIGRVPIDLFVVNLLSEATTDEESTEEKFTHVKMSKEDSSDDQSKDPDFKGGALSSGKGRPRGGPRKISRGSTALSKRGRRKYTGSRENINELVSSERKGTQFVSNFNDRNPPSRTAHKFANREKAQANDMKGNLDIGRKLSAKKRRLFEVDGGDENEENLNTAFLDSSFSLGSSSVDIGSSSVDIRPKTQGAEFNSTVNLGCSGEQKRVYPSSRNTESYFHERNKIILKLKKSSEMTSSTRENTFSVENLEAPAEKQRKLRLRFRPCRRSALPDSDNMHLKDISVAESHHINGSKPQSTLKDVQMFSQAIVNYAMDSKVVSSEILNTEENNSIDHTSTRLGSLAYQTLVKAIGQQNLQQGEETLLRARKCLEIDDGSEETIRCILGKLSSQSSQ